MTWVALAVGVGSAVAKANSANNQASQKDKILEAGYAKQAASREQGSAVLSGLLQKFGASNPGTAEANSTQAFMDQLRGNQGRIDSSSPVVSGASGRYAHDIASNVSGAKDFATRLSTLMARVNAPQQQRQQESIDTMRAGSKLSQIEDFARGNAGVSGIDVGAVHQNPWLGLLTNSADAFASGYKPRSGGGKGIPDGGAGLLTGPDQSYASSGLA